MTSRCERQAASAAAPASRSGVSQLSRDGFVGDPRTPLPSFSQAGAVVPSHPLPTAPATAADNGAVYLDEHRPGWRDEIDRDRLDLNDSCDCVLGQLYGNFLAGWMTLRLDYKRIVMLGFEAPDGDYTGLQEAWERLL